MRKIGLLLAVLTLPLNAHGDSTINSTNAFSYGANVGWMNWRPSAANGVKIDEYVLSGYIYGANIGWIHVGDGSPTNNIQYSNGAATDFGVNYTTEPASPGMAKLRGFAYGANIGWINFEATGNPRLRFSDGKLQGYVWAANCGWVSLAEFDTATPSVEHFVQTDTIQPGIDSDSDGLADAYEFLYLGGLGGDPEADSDGDGTTDLGEYLNGTLPNSANDRLRITNFTTDSGGASSLLTWSSTPSRLYTIETNLDLTNPGGWAPNTDFGVEFAPDAGMTTTKNPLTEVSGSKRFWRVRSIRPLSP